MIQQKKFGLTKWSKGHEIQPALDQRQWQADQEIQLKYGGSLLKWML